MPGGEWLRKIKGEPQASSIVTYFQPVSTTPGGARFHFIKGKMKPRSDESLTGKGRHKEKEYPLPVILGTVPGKVI
jgi:hypothetical protein